MKTEEKEYYIDLLRRYHLAITHLRQKRIEKKLVLCLGAGFSAPFKIPNWKKLVEYIANHKEVQGEAILINDKLSLTTKIQVLFEIFKNRYKSTDEYKKLLNGDISSFLGEDIIREKWFNIVHECLYSDYEEAEKTGNLVRHQYLDEYIEIILNSPVTVNYNFDDFIERKFDEKRNAEARKLYESTSRPSMQFKRKDSVIYHPNGYIPYKKRSSMDSEFVFSEKSFQDQLIDTMSGRYNPLQYLFLTYTMLLTGLSLDDPTLRHMLRKNAILNPGHFHYYIYYIGSEERNNLSQEEMKSISESYFETFNLITLFLNGNEIQKLAQYIMADEDTFSNLSEDSNMPRSYVYYISGTPGTGKTSSLNLLTDFLIQDEFQDPHKEELYQSDDKLSEAERKELDKWIERQFKIRNRHISDEAINSCIQLVDRSSIDPICFVDNKENARNERAKKLLRIYNKGLVHGKVIVLEADVQDLFFRLNKRNPNTHDQILNYPTESIKEVMQEFERLFPKKDFKYISTTGKKLPAVVKEIAHEIFFGEYKETNLMEILEEVSKETK